MGKKTSDISLTSTGVTGKNEIKNASWLFYFRVRGAWNRVRSFVKEVIKNVWPDNYNYVQLILLHKK